MTTVHSRTSWATAIGTTDAQLVIEGYGHVSVTMAFNYRPTSPRATRLQNSKPYNIR